jgi:hypothetical protein
VQETRKNLMGELRGRAQNIDTLLHELEICDQDLEKCNDKVNLALNSVDR